MSRRAVIAAVIALAIAALFARLGVWQLHRLAERRAFNAEFESRLAAPAAGLATLPTDTALAKYRRVRVHGTFDFDHQFVITARSRQGAPGVWLLTPLRPDSGTTAVLVNRGWVYSPDASSVNLEMWNEPERTTVEGYVVPIPPHSLDDPRAVANPRAWRALDYARFSRAVPYPIEPYYVVELASGPKPADAPTRLDLPPMDEGPHKSYAIQWFTFAAIALYGVGYLIYLEVRRRG